jgi:uncharacterized membrane protein YkvA (DUF1232 family)
VTGRTAVERHGGKARRWLDVLVGIYDGGNSMGNNGAISIVLLVVVALYVVSPVDLVPGPIDDIILMLLYARSGSSISD